jgi:hypothetical protein
VRVLDLVVLLALVLVAALVFAMFRTGGRDQARELEAVRRRIRNRAREPAVRGRRQTDDRGGEGQDAQDADGS